MKSYSIRKDSRSVETTIDYKNELNSLQHEVVCSEDGASLVIAGAGTGKTRTIIYRVAWLIQNGIAPQSILLLTFTNKAAKEMMKRTEGLLSKNITALWGGTFHHVANKLLRNHAKLIGYKNDFLILDRTDTKDMLDSCVLELNQKEKIIPASAIIVDVYSFMKNTNDNIESVLNKKYPQYIEFTQELMDIITLYEAKKLRQNMMDFDDLLLNLKLLLQEHNEVCNMYSNRFRHVLVDEYQDTNTIQGEIVDLISRVHGNIMAVGDDGQSIFSFRGANFENILNFPLRHKNVKIYKLTINYRSTPEILALANSIIVHNKKQFPKQLEAVKESGVLPTKVAVENVYEQAEFVASKIMDIRDDGHELSSVAVLYRSHYQAMEMELELKRRGISYDVRSGLKFLEQAHIKDILSYLRILANPFDELSWVRILKMIPGVGNKTADRIWKEISGSDNPIKSLTYARHHIIKKGKAYFEQTFLPIIVELEGRDIPAACLTIVLENIYEQYLFNRYDNAELRLEDIKQMIQYANKYETIAEFINEMSLDDQHAQTEETDSDRDNEVILSSIHQAKGLEWNTVFIIGLNDGRFPSLKALRGEYGEEEERRLFYVATTRACKELYLCYCLATDNAFLKPSRFLNESPNELLEELIVT
ncbi:MAG: ATP-dependent helicase [Candidatus Magnetoovum sp. WYHC-5]|nr:ATP-dependent helicase [Candidatus Magnetoovum sp. WYHC-5]